ncbi:hypothetical protein [Azospirillum halopraeferens]|uniref:hypothetical protein n=1 Tax=Azospirillum halopraeferens TaxID=34010 RepID=UPI00048FB4A3|nr:hypothetical protein [Azospirillum halopraeferens]
MANIPGEVIEDTIADIHFSRLRGRGDTDFAQNRQQLVQRGPIAGLRAAIPGTFSQDGRGIPLINIACAKAMTLQPTAEVTDQAQRPSCR